MIKYSSNEFWQLNEYILSQIYSFTPPNKIKTIKKYPKTKKENYALKTI